MLESFFPFIHSGATLVPAKLIVPPGSNDTAVAPRRPARDDDLAAGRGRRRAAPPRLPRRRGAGRRHRQRDRSPARTRPGSSSPPTSSSPSTGKPTPTIAKLRQALDAVHPGAPSRSRVRRGAKTLTIRIKTTPDPQDHEPRDRRLRSRPGGGDPPADPRADRRRQRRRPLGRPRVRAPGDGGARPPDRPRLPHRRDRRDASSTARSAPSAGSSRRRSEPARRRRTSFSFPPLGITRPTRSGTRTASGSSL